MNNLKEINILLPIYKNALKKKEWTRDFFEELKNDITYHSNKIEGLTLTYGETIQFLKFGLIKPKANDFQLRDITALDNHRKILDLIFEQYQEIQISTDSIKEIHRELLQYPLNKTINISNIPGEYKEEINGVFRIGEDGKKEYHEFLPPPLVSGEMEKLVSDTNLLLKNINLDDSAKHPATVAAYFHYRFSNIIHPFHDGNGRIARLFSNLILMKNDFPPVIIKGEENDRKKYINSIITSSEDNLNPLIELFADQLMETMRKGIERANTEL